MLWNLVSTLASDVIGLYHCHTATIFAFVPKIHRVMLVPNVAHLARSEAKWGIPKNAIAIVIS
jgi:hypothetical protein